MTTKQEALDEISDLLGLPHRTVYAGSSLPVEVFAEAAARTGVSAAGMPEITEAIIRKAGHPWRESFDSRHTPSKGGSTVTKDGLIALLSALRYLLGVPDTYLLTWNPGNWHWDDGDLAEAIASTHAGTPAVRRWSTGHNRRIRPGDRVFLLRQGRQGDRGIMAMGTATSVVFPDAHWDGSARSANYVAVDWALVVVPPDGIPLAVLQATFPDQDWEPQSSGISVDPVVAAELARMWAERAAQIRDSGRRPRVPRGGQDRLLDAARRKRLEDAAQTRLEDHFRAEGWHVEDMRNGNPFDARATLDGDVLYLEAKGTQSAGEHVIVTRGEVAWATEHPGQCVMGIWSGMRFGRDGEVDPDAGDFTLYGWEPDDDELEPITFNWYPPDSKLL